MTREQAWELLCEYTKSDSLRRHALAVEACVKAYARVFGEDEAKWGETALLHDFDYEMHPDAPDHPMKGEPILAERGVDAEIRRARKEGIREGQNDASRSPVPFLSFDSRVS